MLECAVDERLLSIEECIDLRFVFVLNEDRTVSQRRIETGPRVENGWAVMDGLRGGELVAVQGVQRLSEGMTVQPSQGQPVGGPR